MKPGTEIIAARGIPIGKMPVVGMTCPLCKNRILRGMQDAVKFARIDARSGDIAVLYTHQLCASEHNRLSKAESEAEGTYLVSDERTLRFWAGCEEKMRIRQENPEPPAAKRRRKNAK